MGLESRLSIPNPGQFGPRPPFILCQYGSHSPDSFCNIWVTADDMNSKKLGVSCKRKKYWVLSFLSSLGLKSIFTKIQLRAVENNLEMSKNTAIYRFLCAYSPTKQRLHLLVQYLSGNPVMVNDIIVRPISICAPIKSLKWNIHPCGTKCTLWDNSYFTNTKKLATL